MSTRTLAHDLHATLKTILVHRQRLGYLLNLGPAYCSSLARFLSGIIPQALDELSWIEQRAERIPDPILRELALSSIHEKAYHVQGGCVLATFLPLPAASRHLRIVAALETIYDYLDTLCDRLPEVSSTAYPSLHDALLDAVDLERSPGAPYRDGPFRDDGGYLAELVASVRANLATLPHYHSIRPHLSYAVTLYRDLQSYKHLPAGQREARCQAWYAERDPRFDELRWYEFAAACGSSLPVFALLALTEMPDFQPAQAEAVFATYLPAIAGLHILLDSFLDQAEDREHDELNFYACYASEADALERLARFIHEAQQGIAQLAHPQPHHFLFEAMRGFYLTHPKVFEQALDKPSNALLAC